jgi:hypothetical protein
MQTGSEAGNPNTEALVFMKENVKFIHREIGEAEAAAVSLLQN